MRRLYFSLRRSVVPGETVERRMMIGPSIHAIASSTIDVLQEPSSDIGVGTLMKQKSQALICSLVVLANSGT